jgi:glucan phosphoethanolaminetransferase (alkaline phosphatase superfamily)
MDLHMCNRTCPPGTMCDVVVAECVDDVQTSFSVIGTQHYIDSAITMTGDLDTSHVKSGWSHWLTVSIVAASCVIVGVILFVANNARKSQRRFVAYEQVSQNVV